MAAPATNDEYLDLVRKSGVTDEKRLDAHIDALRAGGGLPPEPKQLAGVLVRDGLLTYFQADQILKGKWRRFSLGKYKVLEQLGSGGMGKVFLCEHKLMRRRVAVKVLPSAKAAEPSSLERFYREAKCAAALDHPNIVHAYDIDHEDSLHFIVMEYVDGASFQELVKGKNGGPLDPLRAAHYIRQAALGLQHAHEAGLVHRDIKPGNILVDRSGMIKLLDLGLARFFSDEEDILTRKYDENVLGTADYLAPEQALDSHTVDIRADVYSLGATFYFLLTGQTPFGEGTTAQKLIWHQTRHPRPIRSVRADVPAGMAAVLERMMAKDPADRYQLPSEVAEALAPWTRQGIAPPSEAEMPTLSPAACPPSLSGETTQTSAPRTPTSPPPRKTWQVATSTMARPQLPPAAAGLSTPGATGSRTPLDRRPVPPLPTREAPAQDDGSLSWEQVTADGPRAAGRTPGTRAAAKRLPTSAERRFWRMMLIVAALTLAVLFGIGLATGFFARLSGGREAAARPPLKVSRQPGQPGVHRSVGAALEVAEPGDVVLLLDPEHRESLLVDGSRRKLNGVRIEPAAGVPVVWAPPAGSRPDGPPLLHLADVQGLRLRNIVFDGENLLDRLVRLTGSSPGLALEDVTLRNFRKAGLAVANCAGEAGRPVEIVRLSVTGAAKADKDGPESAVVFSANPNVTPPDNAHVQLRDYRIEGQFRERPVTFASARAPTVEVTPAP